MKYSILILLLFALVISKRQNPLLSLAKTMLHKSGLKSTDDYYPYPDYDYDEDESSDIFDNRCPEYNQNANQCKATVSFIPFTQCCYYKVDFEKSAKNNIKLCNINIYPFDTISSLLESSKITDLAREILGFIKYGLKEDIDDIDFIIGDKATVDVNCQDKEIKKTIEIKDYTDDDKKVFQYPDYCLYDLMEKIANLTEEYEGDDDDYYPYPYPDYTKLKASTPNCGKLKILQSSKKNGLSCGYVKVNVDILEYISFSFDSCILFSNDIFSKIKIPSIVTDFVKTYMKQIGGEFKVELDDKKGHKFVLDSKTGEFRSKSSFVSISKYLFILIGLILF